MSRLIGKWIRNGNKSFERWRNYSNSRKQADEYRKRVVESKSHPFVDGKIIERAKQESEGRFGDPGHWHWLALYAELREKYVEGWLPGDLYTYRLIPYLNPRRLAYLSTVKSFDHSIFSGFAAKPVGRVVNGCYFSQNDEIVDKHLFLRALKNYGGEIVIKEDSAPSGEGIYFISSDNIDSIFFNPQKSYLLQPVFKQHYNLEKIYSSSVNTVRISTYLSATGELSVKHKILRIGSGGSRIVNAGDNDIDIYLDDNGNVVRGAVDGIGRARNERHPETGVAFKDIKVPSIAEAEKACINAHFKFPYLRFIAWDLYIDTNSVPRMIEWNAVNPGMWVHEANIGPLWSKEEIGEAMERK